MAIFLTVMNALSDTLRTRADLGFTLPSSSISVNHLLYADDACIVSSTPAGCQHLLDVVQRWLEWAQLKAKVPKCHSIAFQASSGKVVNPGLSVNGETIPLVDDKFLGMPVRLTKNNNDARASLQEKLKLMLEIVDSSLLTRQQKHRLYKYGA